MKAIIPKLLIRLTLMIPITVNGDEADIFTAARGGDVNAINACKAKNCNLNARNEEGYTAFILAAYHNHQKTLTALKLHGADPCALDPKGNSAMMGVAFKGYTEIAKWLLEYGKCDVNHQKLAGQTALMMAALFNREAIIQLLLAHGAKPDLADYQGNTAAKLAQAQGLSKVVEIIKFQVQ